MTLSTSTVTLAPGSSRTYTLAPGEAVTVATEPNCYVTVTETPDVISSADLDGQTNVRTSILQYKGTWTYGPYALGGTVAVAVSLSKSTSSVAVTLGSTAAAVVGAAIQSAVWGGNKNSVLVIGDSWGGRHYSASAQAWTYADIGAITWAQALSGQRLNIVSPEAALGGTTSADWANGRLATYLSGDSPGWVVCFLGVNDIANDVPLETTKNNLQAVYAACLARGCRLIICNVPPYGPTYVVSGASLATKNANRALLNEWIANYVAAHSNCWLIDQFSALVSPTDTSGYMVSANSDDTVGTPGLHSTATGARVVGALIAAIFNANGVFDSNIHASSYIDSYDYDTNSRNRISNPLMLGSGGSTSPGAGTTIVGTVVPQNWTVASLAGTSTTTVTTPARTVSNDGDVIGNNCRMSIAGAAAGELISLRSGSISSRFAQGDLIVGEAFVRVSSASGLKGVRLLAQSVQGGVTYTATGMSFPASGYKYDNSNALLVIKTPPLLIGAGALSGHVLTLDVAFASAGGAIVDVGRVSWRRVN